MAVPLLAVALWLLAASPVSAADGPDVEVVGAEGADGADGSVVGAEGADVLRVVGSAQSEVEADPDSGSDRRLVDRESSVRIDAVVIALWTIAGVMTVLLGLFLWHTSPRRRLRLAGGGSAGWSGEAEGGAEPAGAEPGEDAPGKDSPGGDFGAKVREALLWLRSRPAPRKESESAGDGSQQESESAGDGSQQESESAGDGSQQESESAGDGSQQESESAGEGSQQDFDGESVDESAVWKFNERDGGHRSV